MSKHKKPGVYAESISHGFTDEESYILSILKHAHDRQRSRTPLIVFAAYTRVFAAETNPLICLGLGRAAVCRDVAHDQVAAVTSLSMSDGEHTS